MAAGVTFAEAVPTLAGVVVGAALTLFGSLYLESRRNRHRLSISIEIVVTELEENQRRLTANDEPTLGDWEQNKGSLAQLALKDPDLWKDLAKSYGQIYGAITGNEDPPRPDELGALVKRLEESKRGLI